MKFFNLRSIFVTSLSLTAGFACCLFISACKSNTAKPQTENKQIPNSQISTEQKQAEQIIENDPRVEIVAVIDEQLHIQNIYTKRSLTLPFQMIIDGHYQMIQEDKELAASILKNQEAKKKNSPVSQLAPQKKGWGITPVWIPRYPDLELVANKIHTPKNDGSIWGYITGTHSDPISKISENIISEFAKSDLKLTRKSSEKKRASMIFDNNHLLNNDTQERRRAHCTISKQGDRTRVSIQYSYGM